MLNAAIEVAVRHDWLDYVGALGGFAGGIAGLVALIFAGLSKRDAERSATAAEQALALMREEAKVAEAEREKRADPVAQLSALAFVNSKDELGYVVLNIRISNEGTRAAERLMLSVVVADPLSIAPCDEVGAKTALTSSERLGTIPGKQYWAKRIDSLDLHIPRGGFLRLQSPAPGSHRITVRLSHEDIPTGQRARQWDLEVPDKGGALKLEEVLDSERSTNLQRE